MPKLSWGLYFLISRDSKKQSWLELLLHAIIVTLLRIVCWMCDLKLAASALLLKHSRKLFKENKNLKCLAAMQVFRHSGIMITAVFVQSYSKTPISLVYVFSITSWECQFVNYMRFQIHSGRILVWTKWWKFLCLIEDFEMNRLHKTSI